ncbi:hypothetical protein C6Y11_09785 [Lactiplantibacillus pentosus]|uniref:Alpha/beta superfamily hydrolase n=1 Tax=Lactiplantibacillus pentosus IG1 TaxID=1042160 RepID=G0M622_LACPE|nr:alpha/beta hydrolase [Lactiplantibacillus pentosus]CCC17739.1 alpha/beta superfamily hydrolase [Lactiplantibacillus pentosus IG1]MCT3302310.1 alpha/beta hydrolase [Lactiplantibacillus pentosus]PRO79151.1 hypothetical protein C6Y11_09785 [Lactiplantibacillus pentosus]PRO81703.1 hypothetical protein C6Y09_06030 [Lactiplantibacillus pentosus]PRO90491.1 hypothetical protein C6Y12_09085 [Lactiplantibacillus pentosus]
MSEYDQLKFQSFGSGRCVLVFLHGFPLNSKSLINNFEPYFGESQQFTRVYIDLPGMGKSRNVLSDDYDQTVEMIVKLLQVLFSNRQLIVIGNSYGCYLGIGLLKSSLNISGLFLIAPMLIPDKDRRNVEHLEHALVTFREDSDEYQAFSSTNCFLTKEKFNLFKDVIDTPMRENQSRYLARFEKNSYAFVKNNIEITGDVPICIIAGLYDNIVGYKDSKKYAQQHENVNIKVINNAGHNILIDRPECVVSSFRDFLRNIPSR